MFYQDDDGQQGLVLTLVLGVTALLVALVIGVGIYQSSQSRSGQSSRSGQNEAATKVSTVAAPAQVLPVAARLSPADAASAAQAASDAVSVKVEHGVVKFYFASGKADLAAGAGDALVDVIKGTTGGSKLLISGFHDATGDATRNIELARQRAMAVRHALNAAGVPDRLIELKKPEPMAASSSDAEARRVEVSIQ